MRFPPRPRGENLSVERFFSPRTHRKSDLWPQIFADVAGVAMRRFVRDADAPFGSAYLAGMAMEVFKKPEGIKKWLSFREESKPNRENHKLYSKYYDMYKRLYLQTRDIMGELATL